jgi:hypothetical protein
MSRDGQNGSGPGPGGTGTKFLFLTGTRTGTKFFFLPGPGPGPKKTGPAHVYKCQRDTKGIGFQTQVDETHTVSN